MESASVKWHRQTRWLLPLPPCLIKWAVTLAWAAKSERKNQIEMTQLMTFMVYAHFIIMRLRFFSPFFPPSLASLLLSAIFQHFPLLAISSRDAEGDHKRA